MIKKIPFLRNLISKFFPLFHKPVSFSNTFEYWEERYKKGGNSGAGSYNKLAEFKAEVINKFVSKHSIKEVIEFGCGDGNQLQYFQFTTYIGYDVSSTAISICKAKYRNDDTKTFKLTESYNGEIVELALSLDVIFHLIEDKTYSNYMKRLFSASNKYVIIYSSNKNDVYKIKSHVKHRKFTDWVDDNRPEYKLIKYIPNKYPFNGDGETTSFADFYIYEKEDK